MASPNSGEPSLPPRPSSTQSPGPPVRAPSLPDRNHVSMSAKNPAVPERTHASMSMKAPSVPDRTHASMSLPKTPGRRDPPPLPPPLEGDWETKEEVWVRELEEARARAAQMEKTMRWWSDCTANWREKWSKVRNERNKSREECRNLRSKLETYAKECSNMKKDKSELKKLVETLQQQQRQRAEEDEMVKSQSITASNDLNLLTTQDNKQKIKLSENPDDFVSQLLSRKDKGDEESCSSKDSELSEQRKPPGGTASTSSGDRGSIDGGAASGVKLEDPLMQQKLYAVTVKLEEAQKTIQAERVEKNSLIQQVEQTDLELSKLKSKLEELQVSRDQVQTQLTSLQQSHRNELGRVTDELEEEFSSRSDMDQQLLQLRKELEKLQAENAQEWGKRERLESEKLALERENKKLRIEVDNLEEDIQRKNQQASVLLEGDLKTLQFDIVEKNKEISELRHSQNKLKKLYSEKCQEVEHARSRTEQYELEVKRLRSRVDELKQELASGEDEVDQQANQIRRLQRTNDELQVQCENLQVQVEHLQTRLRSTNANMLPALTASSHKNFSVDESLDIPTTDDDAED